MHSELPGDARRWERIPVEIPAEIFRSPKLQAFAATALDLSWNGVRVRIETPALAAGERVEVVLLTAKGWDRRAARVIWVGPGPPERCVEAGIEFLRPVIDVE